VRLADESQEKRFEVFVMHRQVSRRMVCVDE
jgi:hypothetical protein